MRAAGRPILLLVFALVAAFPAAAQVPDTAAQVPDAAVQVPSLLGGALAPPVSPPGELPAWFKYLHFLAGISVGLSASELVRESSSPWLRPLVAVGAAAAAGIGKEILDATGFGDPRVSDAVVTAIGGIAAAGILFYAQSVYPAAPPGPVNNDAYVISTAAVLALPVIVGAIQEIQRYNDRRRAGVSAAP
jgi:hypothetical protein